MFFEDEILFEVEQDINDCINEEDEIENVEELLAIVCRFHEKFNGLARFQLAIMEEFKKYDLQI